uniref:Nuclear cap-binding protein subunit 2 n=1 Tax=Latimeria chalumnae TaxID=7897 RepID=H3B5R9_LATCH
AAAVLKALSSDSYCEVSQYRDRHCRGSRWQQKFLKLTSTLYVGNLSFYTTEEQIHELFLKCGDVKRIIMGLDKVKKTPCGFCFIEYFSVSDASRKLQEMSSKACNTNLPSYFWKMLLQFENGNTFSLGEKTQKVRGEYRTDYNAGRGGFGKIVQWQ